MTEQLSAEAQSLLAQRLRRRPRAGSPAIPRRTEADPPLSYPQERLWFMEQYAPGTRAYTIPVVRRIRGPLDPHAVREALGHLIARHEALRTGFPATDDGRPLAVLAAHADPVLRVVSATGEQQAQALVDDELARPVDPADAPLLRGLLIRLAPEHHILVLAVHHLACDGWSAELLLGELLGLVGGQAPQPEPAVRYGDFAAWQRATRTGESAQRDLAYWVPRLAGVPALHLVTDKPRPAQQTFAGAQHQVSVDASTVRRLTALAHDHAATPYMLLLAAFQTLLARLSGQRDFAVGTPVAGRHRPELEDVVGVFVNTLAMRADLDGDPSFTQLLDRVRASTLDAFAHQELPFEQLVTALDPARDVSRPPVFQVLFALQNYGPAVPDPAALRVEGYPVGSWATRFELELYVTEGPDGWHCQFIYNPDLFHPAGVEAWATAFRALLAAVSRDPDTPLSRLAWLDEPAQAEALAASRGPVVDLAPDATLPALIEAGLADAPEQIAVTAPEGALTRGELAARANRIAHRLRRAGAGPGTIVAVHAERSLDLIAALVGVLKSGAAYLPLDPDYPPQRLRYMLADSGAAVLLTQRRLDPPDPDAATVLHLDDPDAWRDQPRTNPIPLAGPHDGAYAIYTSGSTGLPKGTLVSHQAICNRLHWMQQTYRIGAHDAVLQKTPASFDVSVWEFFWPLIAGARLVLARPGGHKDPGYLRDVIATERVTTAHFVPSMLGAFLTESDIERCTSLRRVICSGEELPPALAARLHERLAVEVHNLYGPTEAAVDVSAWPCPPEQGVGVARLPIGTPIQNISLYVLDEHHRMLPAGVPGQLFIAGVGLAHGYLGRPAATARSFRPDPYGPPGSRMYATGDLARRRPDGALEFLGRIDRQIKLRGIRIEPGEIEAALTALPGVAEAAVVVREDRPGDQRLVGYLTGQPDDPAAVRAALKRSLPDHLVPTAFVHLDALPLGPSGKLDRAALPAPQRVAPATSAAPQTPTEVAIAQVWQNVLGVDRVGLDDDFFDLGGHSLLAIQVVAHLRTRVGAGISVMDLFQQPTVRELAALAEAGPDRPRHLLNELTRTAADTHTDLTLVCVPYGGGSAVVYQPLADALPAGHRLFAVTIPGHDLGADEDPLPFDELIDRCVSEILDRIDGPIALYGHCGIGSAVAVELARRLEATGRSLDAVYIGAIFPFARPTSRAMQLLSRLARRERLTGHRVYENWLRGLGLEMAELDQEQAHRVIRNMRRDSDVAEQRFSAMLHDGIDRIAAPVVSVVGDRDPATEFASERFREWHFLSHRAALVVLDEAGHFYLKYRAEELAQIVTTVHPALGDPTATERHARRPGRTWWLAGESSTVADASHRDEGDGAPQAPATPTPEVAPSMGRFLAVAAGQLVSITGSALTEFAIPIWIYLTTGSLAQFALFTVLGLVPGLLIAPLAGAIVDRTSRKRVLLAADCAAGGTQVALGLLLATGNLQVSHIYALITVLSVALTFQRLAYGSAIPQLVPKHYLGHANGIVQMINGGAAVMAPLLATALMATIGLGGILLLDIAGYAVAIAVTAFVRFPATAAWKRRESLAAEIRAGLRYSWDHRGLRAMLLFFAVLNIFLSPLFILLTPLTMSFGGMAEAGQVAVCGGLGAVAGGLLMGMWGGPRRLRMRGMLAAAMVLAVCCVIPGLRPSLWVVGAGAFAMSLALNVMNGIYFTTVQVKVAQRYHGRVFALNTVISWSTLPLGFGVVAPVGSGLFEPLMAHDGPLAGTAGRLLGTGEGRGTALMYVVFAGVMALIVVLARRTRTLRRFDHEVADAPPDDLVGLEIIQQARQATGRDGTARDAVPGHRVDTPAPEKKEVQRV
ncbi:non-ribosomal peptide synthetase/MFS transporter [Micromonospora coxensis]|uniref:Amino acid adenylation domain-containing protein n=1 Tax=Micromonospora coxensis TaxID=356852 RepID=A0A1C5K0Z9_9ACTN|nr:non-ribosomal peptide synthetase/MFS transporter [Micromonospora coxensis]SCG75976.1 amino acid adenylation domain-containing protein [Micromonospora coxensis]